MWARSFNRWTMATGAAAVLGLSAACWACNVPVFRYALENWQPDTYQVLVLSRGSLDPQQQGAVSRLTAAGGAPDRPANLQVQAVDLEQTTLSEALAAALRDRPVPAGNLQQLDAWARELTLEEPQIAVFYPGIWDRIAWQASLSAASAEQLVDSPLRREVARRLLDGQSAVWVLLESGDAEQDNAAWERLQRELTHAVSVVQLPPRDLIVTDEFYRPEVQIELRVEFSAVRLKANDPAEQAFASLLRGSEADLREFDEPIAIPIYGRGRTYFALVGAGINGTTVQESGQFLCGACSCQVKEDNPGLDMLMAVNWAALVQGTAMPEVVVPPLTGIAGLEAAQTIPAARASAEGPTAAGAASDSAAAGDRNASPAATSPTQSDTTSPPAASVPITGSNGSPAGDPDDAPDEFSQRLLFGVAGGALMALAVVAMATFWLRRTL